MVLLINILAITLVVIILLVIIYAIHSMNKKLKEKISIEKGKLNAFYEKYNKINRKNPKEKDLDELDKFARELFKEKDDLNYKISYVELAKIYNDKKETTKYNFCKEMSKIMYSQDSPKQKDILEVMKLFEEIVKDLHLPNLK